MRASKSINRATNVLFGLVWILTVPAIWLYVLAWKAIADKNATAEHYTTIVLFLLLALVTVGWLVHRKTRRRKKR